MPSRLALTAVVLVLAVAASADSSLPLTDVSRSTAAAAAARPVGDGRAVYVAPISPLRVTRAFRAPVSTYGPGHRGVDLAAGSGAVGSAGDGTVSFAATIAGRGVVVVRHRDGVSTEYEPVTPAVRAGAVVRAGQLIGRVHGRHLGCSLPCLHWGARRGGNYIDPLTLLRPLGPVVLLPWPRGG